MFHPPMGHGLLELYFKLVSNFQKGKCVPSFQLFTMQWRDCYFTQLIPLVVQVLIIGQKSYLPSSHQVEVWVILLVVDKLKSSFEMFTKQIIQRHVCCRLEMSAKISKLLQNHQSEEKGFDPSTPHFRGFGSHTILADLAA